MGLEQEVLDKMEQISEAEAAGDYSAVHRRLSEKRMRWCDENIASLSGEGSLVRRAYEMILLHYMKLPSEEVPVVYEDEKRIVWRSYNWCPVLEACGRLGIDTRKACREGWEKSVQEMVERIDPRLRFSRNYNTLRPHGEFCEEEILLAE